MACIGAEQATSHCLNQWFPRLPTHICVTQLIKTHVSANYRPSLFQIMACHLFGTKQLSKRMVGNCLLDVFNEISVNRSISIQGNSFQMVIYKMLAVFVSSSMSQRLTFTLQWRHNGRDGVSNHQPHQCLPNRLFGRKSKKTSKLRVTGLCAGNSPGTGEFPAQWPVTRKMFPFDDVIMFECPSHQWDPILRTTLPGYVSEPNSARPSTGAGSTT